jgi:DNA polymerase
MADIRGQIFDYHAKKLLVTYHPAALLRNPNWKRFVWEDMKNLKSLYDEHLKTK